MDKEYWENFYTKQYPSEEPSDFARFCAKRYKKEFGHLFDIGCGNGRDTLFFSSQSIPCTGIEQSESAVEKNIIKNTALGLDASFYQNDFSACKYDELADGPYSVSVSYTHLTLPTKA